MSHVAQAQSQRGTSGVQICTQKLLDIANLLNIVSFCRYLYLMDVQKKNFDAICSMKSWEIRMAYLVVAKDASLWTKKMTNRCTYCCDLLHESDPDSKYTLYNKDEDKDCDYHMCIDCIDMLEREKKAFSAVKGRLTVSEKLWGPGRIVFLYQKNDTEDKK